LPAARDMGRRQIISTLGNRRDAKAVKPLAKLARDAEAAVAEAAIRALGKIATDSAAREIAALRKEANPACQRALADASLRCAAQLADSGKAKAAARIYEELAATSQPANVRRGAFIALTRLDPDGGEQRILQTLRNGDAVLKPVAIAAVRSLRSETASEAFAREMPALTNAEKVWLIESLAARGDTPARVAILGSLESPDAGVRRAAAAALGHIGGATTVRPLAQTIAKAKDSDEIRELVSALGSLPSDRATDQAIIAEIKGAQGDPRARLIAALATRPGPQVTTLLLEEAGNPDLAVAKAAYRVLARAGAGDSLPLLLQKFAALRDAALRSEVEGFVEQAVSATEDATRRSAAVRDALNQNRDVESRCALLRLLPACGDAPALAALNSAVSDVDPRVQDAAVRALAEWPDMSAWKPLFTLWAKPENDAQRSLALHGLVRLADAANAAPNEELLGRYRELLAGVRGDDELKQVLSALGGDADPAALKLVLPLLEQPGVRAEAAAAVKRIAEAIKQKHPEAAQAALDRAVGK
jgi:HEAT repeat protein